MRLFGHRLKLLARLTRPDQRPALPTVPALSVIMGVLLFGTALGAGLIAHAQTNPTGTPAAQNIAYGQSVYGQLDGQTAQDWAFIGAPGDVVQIQAVQTLGNVRLGITLEDANGRSIAGVQAADTGTVTLSDVTLLQPAVYTIHVVSLTHVVGAYQLSLSNSATIAVSPTPVSQLLAGAITAGGTVHGAIDDVNYRQLWRFDGTIGDVIDIQMRVTSGNLLAFVSLISPAGDIITTSAAQPNVSGPAPDHDATIFSIQVPSTGSYQLLARRQGDQQGQLGLTRGTYDLSITSHRLAPSTANTILQPGATLTGRLTPASPISQYQMLNGGIFVLRLTLSNLHRIARIRLLDSSGVELASQSGLSPLVFNTTLPARGPFSVQVSADVFDNQLTTDFSLNLFKITSAATPIAYNSDQRSQAGHSPDHWVFIGQAGDLVRLHIAPDSDAANGTVVLSGPGDSPLFQGTIGPGFDQPFTLPTDGPYQIVVQGGAAAVNYQIGIGWEGVDGLPFARFGVTASKGIFAFDTPQTGMLAPLASQTWTLDVSAGQTINVTVAAQTLAQNVGVLVRAPDESLIAVQDGQGLVQMRRAVLPTTGRYRVIVFNPSATQSVSYTAQLEDAEGGLLSGHAVKGVVLPTNTFAEWSLDAAAGTLITAQLTNRTPAAWTPGLILLDPSGNTLTRVGAAPDRTVLDLSGIRTLVTGRYRLVVIGTVGAAFASYELQADAQTPFTSNAGAPGSITAATPAPGAPTFRYASTSPDAQPTLITPTLADVLDPALPLDPSSAVQTLPFNTLLRGEIAPGTVRQVWQTAVGAGTTLNFRAVTLGNSRGPDLALFDDKQHVVAEQLHGLTASTMLTYFTPGGGSYYLAVRLGLNSGRYTLYGQSQTLTLDGLQTAQGTPLVYGQTAYGELVMTDQPGQIDSYYFSGAANDIISISAARANGDLAPALQLRTLAGKVLASTDNAAADPASALTAFRLINNDMYVIRVQRAASAQATNGRYLLSLTLGSSAPLRNHLSGILTTDQPVYGSLSANDPDNTWLLNGHGGQVITLTVSGLSATDAAAPLSLRLQDIAGHTFAQQDVILAEDSAQLLNVMLPNDGLYRVQIVGGITSAGSYRLLWTSAAPSVNGIASYGQTVTGRFTAGQQAEKWTFAGTVGDVIALSVRRLYGDPFRGAFQILSANGATLASAADLGNGEGARVDGLALPFSGTYTVVVVNPDSAFRGVGVYALGLTLQDTKARAVGGLLTDGLTGVSELYPDDLVNHWLFSGHGGDVVTVQLAAGDHFLRPMVTLQNSSDQGLISASAEAGGTATLNNFRLPADGVYALAVSGADHSSGSYRIRLDFTPPPVLALATIRYGDSAVGLIADDRLTNLYLFSGQPGDHITAQATREAGSSLTITLELRTSAGNLLAYSDSLGSEQATINDFVLPASGQYRLSVGRFGGANGHTSGRLTVTLTGQAASFPIRSAVKSGQLAQGRVDDALPAERWTFDGKAGQVISLSATATSGDLDTYLTLEAPDKSTLAQNDDFNGTNAAIPGVVLPVDGTYTIIVSRVGTRGHGSAGNYDLHADTLFTLGTSAAKTASPISYGQRIVGSLDVNHPQSRWTFAARAGDQVQVLLAHTSDDAPPQLSIEDPSGSSLISGVLHVGQTTIDQYQLPTSGTFNIAVIRPINARALYTPYALTLTLLSTATDSGPMVGGVLPADSSVIGQVTASRSANLWLLQAAAGQILTLDLAPLSGSVQPAIQVIEPGGQLLLQAVASADQRSGQNTQINGLTLPIGGLYALIVTPQQADQTGTYRLTSHLANIDPTLTARSITPNQPFQSTLSDLQPSERWQFQASAGQVISAQLLAINSGWQPALQLVSAAGQLVASSRLDQTPFGLAAVIDSSAIPTDGAYQLIASRNGTGGGDYALTYSVGSPLSTQTLAASLIRYGQSIQAVIDPSKVALWAFEAQSGDVVDVSTVPALVGPKGAYVDAPAFMIEDTNGHILAQAALVGHEAMLAGLTLPQAGRYIIALNSAKASGYNLLLQSRQLSLPARFSPRTLISDKAKQNGIDSSHLLDYWTFNAQAGDGIQLPVMRLTGDLRLDVSLYGPNGYITAAAADSQTTTVTLGALRLPDSGTYTVVVGRWQGTAGKTSGGYQITLKSADPAPLSSAVSVTDTPAPVYPSLPAQPLTDQGALALNTFASADLNAAQIGHLWTFAVQPSPTVAVELIAQSASLPLRAVIISADNRPLGYGRTDAAGHLWLEVPLPAAGHYALQILPQTVGASGRYQVRISYALAALGGGRLVSGTTVSGTLTDAHFTDNWRFDAQASSAIHIDARRSPANDSTDNGLAVTLIDPAGNPTSVTTGGSDVIDETLPVEQNGTYSLLISRQGGAAVGNNTGYTLTLTIALPTF